jgi:hypothetical protein
MENHKEDILKNFLQDTFSDYEPEPSDASWEKIFTAIQPDKPSFWTKSKPWIASGLVILTATLLWYSLGETEENNTEIALNESKISQSDDSQTKEKSQSDDSQTKDVIAIKPHSDLFKTNVSKRIEKISTGIKSDGNFTKSSVETTGTHSQTTTEGLLVKTPTRAITVGESNKEIIVKSDAPKEAEGNHPIVGKQSDESVVDANLIASTSERVETLAMNITQSDDSQTANDNVKRQVRTLARDTRQQSDDSQTASINTKQQPDRFQTAKTSNTIIEQVRYIRPMESLKNKDFIFTKIDLNSPMISTLMLPNREAKPVRQHTYLSMSITPIQTYRILTIKDQNVQNVQTNSIFDSERNGWQFDLGITKPIGKLWNFRTNLSYLRMRQWSEYQVGTNELILRNNNFGSSNSNPSQDNSADLEVVGQTVTESKMLHMVGLKMDVQRFIKITPKNRYFLSTGTQVMYENSQKQSNIFLNVSAGFQHVISNHTFLTIEPTASYSLNNFNDSRSLLQANGYNLGLKMGVSFRVK